MKTVVVLLNALPEKKIKSLGNKCLLNATKHDLIIDSHIKTINKIFNSPTIIVIGGFDSKKLKKYIKSKYKDCIYLEHHIDNFSNIGQSLKCMFTQTSIQHYDCFILNSSILLSSVVKSKIQKNMRHSFVLAQKKGDIGYIQNNNRELSHCYYGLPNGILEALFITHKDLSILQNVIKTNKDIDHMYLFEIINLCIEQNLKILPLNIGKKEVSNIESMHSLISQEKIL